MYTTRQAIDMLVKNEIGLIFKMAADKNTHIFKTVDGKICRGVYRNDSVVDLEDGLYATELWEVDYENSKAKDYLVEGQMHKFKLYINIDNEFVFYGCGDMKYIMELLNDYLVVNNMYNYNSKEFTVERF